MSREDQRAADSDGAGAPGTPAARGPLSIGAFVVGPTEGWTLEPASPKRDWMDATDGFAYRCLPLVIANQAGWVVRCPADFEAVWDGSDGADATTVRFPPASERFADQILSHFGWGILTFSIPWLFRTSPGVALVVRGAPNVYKPNLAPLEGVVETDWAASTFTMNWKIVEPDRVVRFGAGDPVCFLQPMPLSLIESFDARVSPLDADPTLAAEYRDWSASRTAFNERTDRRPEEWQKDYVRGQTSRGTPAREHRSRLNVPRFDETSGSGTAPGDPHG